MHICFSINAESNKHNDVGITDRMRVKEISLHLIGMNIYRLLNKTTVYFYVYQKIFLK